ncbi:unnamed protein product [Dibothriocephalus latus]|uniref:Syntaxin N-terminal domain-containing protein n=1 Tax=Dibothriocephalus latus TaxID=60516 RepID=A0A3P6SZB0_DIBLA|nr:unnamed protein product [Dibothriocephalus latus]
MVQGLACTLPDDATLRQLQETADRLRNLEKRLGAYVEPMTDPKFGSSKEKEAMLDELLRVTGKINDTVELFQSFERMRRREEEKKEVLTLYIAVGTTALFPKQ